MWVQNYMTRDPMVVAPEDSLRHARSVMMGACVRHLPVVRDGRLEGVITDRDIRDYMPSRCRDLSLHELGAEIEAVTVDQVMSRLPVTVGPDCTMAEAAAVLLARGVGCLPVMSGERLVGLVTRSDVLRVIAAAHRLQTEHHVR